MASNHRRYLDAPIGPITHEMIVKSLSQTHNSDLKEKMGIEVDAAELFSLSTIRLEQSGITEIDNLELCSNIEAIYLQYNFINAIENVDFLPRLKLLNLRGNRIQTIEGLKRLTNLQILDLANNHVAVFPSLDEFPESLEYLWLEGNTFCEDKEKYDEYVGKLIDFLPDLVEIDGVEIEREDEEDEEGDEEEYTNTETTEAELDNANMHDVRSSVEGGTSIQAALAQLQMEATHAVAQVHDHKESIVERSRDRRAKYIEDSMKRHQQMAKNVDASLLPDDPESQKRRSDLREQYHKEYDKLSSQDVYPPRSEMFSSISERLLRLNSMHTEAVSEGSKIQGQTQTLLTTPSLSGVPNPLPTIPRAAAAGTTGEAVPVKVQGSMDPSEGRTTVETSGVAPINPSTPSRRKKVKKGMALSGKRAANSTRASAVDPAAPVGEVVLVRVGSAWVAKPREPKSRSKLAGKDEGDVAATGILAGVTRPYKPRSAAKASKATESKNSVSGSGGVGEGEDIALSISSTRVASSSSSSSATPFVPNPQSKAAKTKAKAKEVSVSVNAQAGQQPTPVRGRGKGKGIVFRRK